MAINFPKNAATGTSFTVPEYGQTYVWDGASWLSDGVVASGGGGGTVVAGVDRIVAGSGVIVSPSTGSGVVTVSAATGGGSGGAYPGGDARLIDDLYTGSWANAMIEAGRQGGTWVFPVREYVITKPVVITADGTKFVSGVAGDKPKFTFDFGTQSAQSANGVTQNHVAGLWAAAKFRVTGIYFQWAGSRIDTHKNDCLVLFQKGNTSQGQRDDMDSSIDNCTFSNARCNQGTAGAGCITYYGRNMRVTGCTFSSGGGSGDMRAISLSYASNPDDVADGQTISTAGWRKNIVSNNTFHMTKDAICLEVFQGTGAPSGICYGLVVSDNTNDVGGSLLRVSNGAGLVAAAISGNACIRSSGKPYIQVLSGGTFNHSSIAGNAFGSADANKNNEADGVTFESGSTTGHVTITGNSFGAPENGCIRLLNAADRVAVVGNTFAQLHGSGSTAIETSGGRGTFTGNVSSMSTFHSGSGTWTSTGNDT